MAIQGNLKTPDGQTLIPNTSANAVADIERERSLAYSLGQLVERSALGYPAFTTTNAYAAGDVVFYDRKLYKFTSAHAAGAWNASHVTEYSIKEAFGGEGIFDISAYHASRSTLATYANLAAALDSNNGGGVPVELRKGGMTVKFVLSSDNKYVQYRYMGTETTGNPNPFLDSSNWQGVDEILNRLGVIENNNVLRLSLTSGKNLFDKSKGFCDQPLYSRTVPIATYRSPYTSGTYCNTPPISVKGGEKVTLSSTAELNNVYNVQYDANGSVLTATASDNANKTIQLHENAAYIRCSLKYSNSANFQVEYGTTSTEYEAYRVVVAKEGLTPSVQEIVDANYKIAAFREYPVGKNLYNKANVRNGALYSATTPFSDGVPYVSGTYCSTNLIPVFGGRDVIVNYNSKTNNVYTIAYDAAGNIVLALQNTAANALFKLPVNAAWLRVSFYYSDNDRLQIEYGTVSTDYENYVGGSFIEYTQLYSKRVNDIVSKQVDAEFICPSKIYAMAGKNNLLYYKQMIVGDSNALVSLNHTTLLRLYKEYIRVYDDAAKNIETTISTRGTLFWNRVKVTCKNVVAPASEKTIKILPIGDSMTDLGFYETWLKEYLGDDNVNVEYIGSKGNPPIIYEALSGGNLSWITSDKGVAYIVDVSNMDAYPYTGYEPVTYKDSNNVVWQCKGAKLTLSEGKYSGKLKFAIFNTDGTPVDHAVLPASGTLTKTNSKAGDATISYSNAVEVNYNPFWNIASDTIDISNYLTKWGFNTPDVILMQFGYNEGLSDSAMFQYVSTAVSRTKAFIDSVHQQLPNCKIIFGVEPYGAEVSHVFGQGAIGAKKDFMNQFMKQMIATFDNATYNFVYLVPTYGKMSTTYGYGALIQQNFSVYQDANITTLQQGLDGVHPPYDYGAKEMALGYEPVVVEIANSL